MFTSRVESPQYGIFDSEPSRLAAGEGPCTSRVPRTSRCVAPSPPAQLTWMIESQGRRPQGWVIQRQFDLDFGAESRHRLQFFLLLDPVYDLRPRCCVRRDMPPHLPVSEVQVPPGLCPKNIPRQPRAAVRIDIKHTKGYKTDRGKANASSSYLEDGSSG
jgi:hypothetical protein